MEGERAQGDAGFERETRGSQTRESQTRESRRVDATNAGFETRVQEERGRGRGSASR